MLQPITRSLKAYRSANRSPFSFKQPNPWCPMILYLPVLSEPILAFRSPMRIPMSRRGV